MLGTFLTLLVASAILLGVIGIIVSSSDSKDKTAIKEKSILHLDFKHPIPDRGSSDFLDNFDLNTFETKPTLGLNEILKGIEKAKNDENIEGIFLNFSYLQAGFATIEEIRDALIDFKSSGKFIHSYSESYTQRSYYLASIADEIHMNPAGYFDLKGLSAQMMFFKGSMEKLEIEPQVIRHGKFKSAVEPFILDKMSPENREQSERFVGSIWDHLVSEMSKNRDLTDDKINQLADGLKVRYTKEALAHGLIDKVSYKDEVIYNLKSKIGIDSTDKITLVSLSKYKNAVVRDKDKDMAAAFNNQVAVVYASGEIRSGKSDKEVMGSETIAKAIKKARENDKVKAVVLRVNSPGGSALASDVIWREVTLTKKEKPIIVSMGNVAASGGYYISCAADKIVASENTITGSIGVFGLIPNMQGMLNNKLGITIDTIKTNRHSDIETVFRPLTDEEKNIIQGLVENVYSDFIEKVAEGRNTTTEAVDAIGQGRVWSGKDALEIGLVDELGGLNRAIELAVEMAKLEDYKLKEYPERKDNPVEEILNGLSNEAKASFMEGKLGKNYKYYEYMESLINQRGIFTRMPFDYILN